MLLRAAYQPDETLHSFIFRVCMINGVEQFANLTDNKGHWRSNLKLSKNIRKYLINYSDQDILTLGKNADIIKKNTNTFGNPLEYMSVIRKLYSMEGSYNHTSDSHPIYFCIDCIRDSLKINGYGYFRAPWMRKWVSFCDFHNKPLTICPARPARNSHEVIKKILRGVYPTGSFSSRYRSELLKQTPSLNYLSITVANSGEYQKPSHIYLATCLKNAIKDFIIHAAKCNLHVSLLLEHYRERSKWWPYRNIYSTEEYEVAVMIKAFFNERYSAFLNFWHANSIAITLYGGIFEYTEVSETFYLFQGTDKCGECRALNCPVKAQKNELIDNTPD